ncbi:transcriptional regulator, Crp/Fnr family [Thermaerobacter marianensis DSM 12885]|uniref:Transcriptional regulator, Crp/Fnr family n=1 Tax=Thermaerobacter marianensis (strain ATCC 700841 / DSM 12885 / JCM 10246 / 7p75a) TaxID=644966 RepID=E6SGG9_THEM7|nr:Crp/Fnr family transcriptional regulator [Thermaerobacter marianensis]ADU51621.1 transcriptional regulator, Crp/Fnr family [Thermaerobacter marianensis DSM 12885]
MDRADTPAGSGAFPTRDAVVVALRRIHPFDQVPPGLVAKVATQVHWRPCRAGDVLFREGEPVRAVFLLRAGRVKIVTVDDEGREYIMHLLGPGDLFPAVGLFTGGGYPATAEVIQDGAVGVVTREVILNLVREHGDLAMALLMAQEERIRYLQERIRSLVWRDLRTRVLEVLVKHMGDQLTHQEIAALVGAARESVSRVISEFKRQGLVTRDPSGRWRVRTPDGLGGAGAHDGR